jgi:hypothetical protein
MEFTTQLFHALPHADKAVVLRFGRVFERGVEPRAVILNRHVELFRIEAQRDAKPAGDGVPNRVLKRFG